MRVNKKSKIIAGCSVIILAISGTAYVLTKNDSSQKSTEELSKSDVLAASSFLDENSGVKVNIPTEAKKLPITEADTKDGIFLRLQSNMAPEYFINMRIESGLRLPTQLARLDVLDLVVDGALRSIPTRYPEFSLISEDDAEVAGKKSKEIRFSYKSPAGGSITQSVTLIPLDSDRALYISQQSKSQDFATLYESIFSRTIASVSLR